MSDYQPKLKVALVFGTFPPMKDGGADFVYHLACGLGRQGAEVSVITTTKVAQNYSRPADVFFEVFPIIEKWHGSEDRTRLRDVLRSIQPDVVHLIYPSSFFGNDYSLPFFLKAISGKPLVTTFFSLFKTGSYLRTKVGILSLVLSSDRIVSHSFEYIDFFKRFFPFKKTLFIPVGNNMPVVERAVGKMDLRKKYSYAEENRYLSFSGRMDMSKGVETLFAALRILIDRGYGNVRLLMVGAGDKERLKEGQGYSKEIREYASKIFELERKLDLSGYISWTKYLSPDSFNEHMLLTDICVLPFRSNTLGRTSLINALSLGMPVVTTARRNDPILKDRINVLTVPPDDPGKLALAIIELLNSPDLRAKIGSGGKDLYLSEFTWSSIVNRTMKLYEELV